MPRDAATSLARLASRDAIAHAAQLQLVGDLNAAMQKLPALIFVTGRPGAGKTSLAHKLAREIRCPALCRDEFKEGFVNTTGDAGRPGDTW